jgi:hypothetical protein
MTTITPIVGTARIASARSKIAHGVGLPIDAEQLDEAESRFDAL